MESWSSCIQAVSALEVYPLLALDQKLDGCVESRDRIDGSRRNSYGALDRPEGASIRISRWRRDKDYLGQVSIIWKLVESFGAWVCLGHFLRSNHNILHGNVGLFWHNFWIQQTGYPFVLSSQVQELTWSRIYSESCRMPSLWVEMLVLSEQEMRSIYYMGQTCGVVDILLSTSLNCRLLTLELAFSFRISKRVVSNSDYV